MTTLGTQWRGFFRMVAHESPQFRSLPVQTAAQQTILFERREAKAQMQQCARSNPDGVFDCASTECGAEQNAGICCGLQAFYDGTKGYVEEGSWLRHARRRLAAKGARHGWRATKQTSQSGGCASCSWIVGWKVEYKGVALPPATPEGCTLWRWVDFSLLLTRWREHGAGLEGR
jgi:hypothetical protein